MMDRLNPWWTVGVIGGVLLLAAGGARADTLRQDKRPQPAARAAAPLHGRVQNLAVVATYPTAKPVRVAANWLASSGASQVRPVGQGGGSARGIDMQLTRGRQGQRGIQVIVRADAIAGRYGAEFLCGGKWTAVPDGKLDLTVLTPGGGKTPTDAWLDAVAGAAGGGVPTGPGAGLPGSPGSRSDGRDVGEAFGLGAPGNLNTKPELGARSGAGDPRLMAGDTVTITYDYEETTSSNGETHVRQTITTTDSKGTTTTDTMTADIDKNGNSSETQTVTVTDSEGNVTDSETWTSTDDTYQDPESGGTYCGKSCQAFMNRLQMDPYFQRYMTSNILAVREEKKRSSLGGDTLEPGGAQKAPRGTRPGTEGMPEKPRSGAIDYGPDHVERTARGDVKVPPEKDKKGTLPDPGPEPTKAGKRVLDRPGTPSPSPAPKASAAPSATAAFPRPTAPQGAPRAGHFTVVLGTASSTLAGKVVASLRSHGIAAFLLPVAGSADRLITLGSFASRSDTEALTRMLLDRYQVRGTVTQTVTGGRFAPVQADILERLQKNR